MFEHKITRRSKKNFIFNGFNNEYKLSKLEETDILDTETFARELLPDLIEKTEYSLYYGIFKNIMQQNVNISEKCVLSSNFILIIIKKPLFFQIR